MITVYNELDKSWIDLFTRAWNDLYPTGNPDKPEQLRFLSLDEYFSKIGNLSEKNKAYLMLPIDEKPFKIDANTRAITVPADFAKCAGVVGDNLCEIVTFTIDRYFDYKDLAGDGVQIAVHWKNPKGEEGISKIELKDFDYKYGKIRFGWPLTSDIACAPGNVQFSVRFYEGMEEEGVIKPVYLLNTLTASIPIKAGLSVDNPIYEETNIAETLANFVTNSRYIQAKIPVAPVFDERMGGQNIPTEGELNEDNTLTISALAISPEGYPIEYRWLFDNAITKLTEVIVGDEQDEDYSIEKIFVITDDPKPQLGKTYYIGDEKTGVVNLDNFSADIEYYEQRTALTIKDSDNKEIVGKYYIEAQSLNDYGDGINKSSISSSNYCLVAQPKEFKLEQNLNDYAFILENGLTLKVTADTSDSIAYNWYKTDIEPALEEGEIEIDISNDEGVETLTSITAECVAEEPGWYQVKAIVTKNRDKKIVKSKVCKVVEDIKAPTIEHMFRETIEGNIDLMEGISDPNDLKDIFLPAADETKVTVISDLDEESLLKTEGLKYQWYEAINNGTAKAITDNGGTTNTITIKSPDTGVIKTYYCEIENNLCGKTAKVKSGTFTVIQGTAS